MLLTPMEPQTPEDHMQNVITQITYRLPEAFVNGFRDISDCRYSAGV